MTNQSTIDKLTEMRLTAMADAFRSQINDPKFKEVPFEDRFGMLVDIEHSSRKANRLKRLIHNAGFDQPDASIMDINYTSGRKLNKELINRLATCEYISWYDQLGGDASPLADATIDRIAHDSYRVNITSIDAEHVISMREVYGLDKVLPHRNIQFTLALEFTFSSQQTLVLGIDVGSETHYARAFDYRGIEYSKKPFKFSNTEAPLCVLFYLYRIYVYSVQRFFECETDNRNNCTV